MKEPKKDYKLIFFGHSLILFGLFRSNLKRDDYSLTTIVFDCLNSILREIVGFDSNILNFKFSFSKNLYSIDLLCKSCIEPVDNLNGSTITKYIDLVKIDNADFYSVKRVESTLRELTEHRPSE